MEGIDFHAISRADPVPTLLVVTGGRILAANPAARNALQGVARDGGASLLDLCDDPPEAIRAYLARCSTTPDGVLGALTLKAASGAPTRFRCDGALVRPASAAGTAAVIILRCRAIDEAHHRFLTLTEKIAELDAENHRRAATQRRLETALTEREILLKEVQHRVKNNLQVVSSLLLMTVGRESDKRLRAKLVEAGNRVQAMGIVQRLLYEGGSFVALDAAALLRELCESIRRSYDLPQVQILLEIAPVTLNLDTASPLGLLLNELVSNAFKHAFPGNRPGTVCVSLVRSGDGGLTLTVADDGCGMEAHRPAGNSRDAGMGLALVDALVTQLEARLEVRTGSGTCFELKFRDSDRT